MNNLPELLSIVYVVLITIGYIPALKGLIKDKDVSGVSPVFWMCVVLTVYVSCASLVLTGATLFQYTSVGVNLFLGVACLIIYLIRSKAKDVVLEIFIILMPLTLLVVLHQPTAQALGTFTIIIAYLTQIYSFYKNKNTNGTSKYLYLVIGAGLACLIWSLLLTGGDPHVIITEIVNLILIIICFIQCLYYERKIENGKTN